MKSIASLTATLIPLRGSKYHTEEVPDRPEYRFSRVVEVGEGEIGFDEAFWIIREERVDGGATSTPIEERHATSALHEVLLQTEERTEPFPIHSWQADVEDTKQAVCHVFHLVVVLLAAQRDPATGEILTLESRK